MFLEHYSMQLNIQKMSIEYETRFNYKRYIRKKHERQQIQNTHRHESVRLTYYRIIQFKICQSSNYEACN